MTIISLRLPDLLYQRTTRLAAGRGESLDDLVSDILLEYLEDLEDAEMVADFEQRRAAGKVELIDWPEPETNAEDDPTLG